MQSTYNNKQKQRNFNFCVPDGNIKIHASLPSRAAVAVAGGKRQFIKTGINSRRKGFNSIDTRRSYGSAIRSRALLRFHGSGHDDVGQMRDGLANRKGSWRAK
ncbi:uncharacterized protein LOC143264299 isoform X2 [Megachile rotundata]|uniref:uncharacterized protein LOC143264299 isoform X2 n=1 Tax=Megachile rotundata TaxID=143995 RepID=UPI003FCFDB9A